MILCIKKTKWIKLDNLNWKKIQAAWQNGGPAGYVGQVQGWGSFLRNFGRGSQRNFANIVHFYPETLISNRFRLDWGADDSHWKSCSWESAEAAGQAHHGQTAGELRWSHCQRQELPWPGVALILKSGCRDIIHIRDLHLLSGGFLLNCDLW